MQLRPDLRGQIPRFEGGGQCRQPGAIIRILRLHRSLLVLLRLRMASRWRALRAANQPPCHGAASSIFLAAASRAGRRAGAFHR